MAGNSNPPEVPPFPRLTWDEFFWTGEIVLDSWRGFQCRQGPYTSQSSAEESDGTTGLSVQPPGGVAEQPPSAEQATALRHLLENERAICDAIVNAIFEEYPALRARLVQNGFADESEMPVIERPEQLRDHIGLGVVHVLKVVRDDAAYIGFEFGCTWDEEHGLGVMTHQGRLVELPDMGMGKVMEASLASEEWVADEDISQNPIV